VPRAALVKDVQAHLWAAISGALSGAPSKGGVEPEIIEDVNEPVAKKPATKPTAKTRVAPPVDEEQKSDEEQALAEHADQEEPTSGPGPEVFDLGLGARFGTRSFGYNDSLPGLRGYDLGMSPSIGLHGHWYPGASLGHGVLANIGLDLRGEFMIGVTSRNSDGQKFSTSSHALGVGLRGRWPVSQSVELGLVAGFGQRTFALSNSNSIDPDIPDVSYNFIRLGLDARWQFVRWVGLQVDAAYLAGLSLGELSDKAWFPHSSGNGLEAGVSMMFGSPTFVGEFGFAVERYFMSLNPDPKDPGVVGTGRVAGGALDEYFSLRLGMIYRH
ncbi:MAG TPA: hypothetical protein VHZ95_02645, partial [Polyangiales bacterium]|nr:hypothetical protein [Polyangiales bacterium]